MNLQTLPVGCGKEKSKIVNPKINRSCYITFRITFYFSSLHNDSDNNNNHYNNNVIDYLNYFKAISVIHSFLFFFSFY